MAALTAEIFHLAEQRSFGQTYPVYVNNLKEIGVQSYRVAVDTGHRRIFSGIHQPTLEIEGSMQLKPTDQFDQSALIAALRRTQSGQSDYPTFMLEIADAGVHFYIADLLNRVVIYFGKRPSDTYEEIIPHPQGDAVQPI